MDSNTEVSTSSWRKVKISSMWNKDTRGKNEIETLYKLYRKMW